MSVSTKPVKGMRDFGPNDAAMREHVKGIILDSYRSFGFNQIETPVMENIALLENADGGENLNMLFKVLKRGEKLKLNDAIEKENDLVDYGMRFDLTLPLARFYANNHAQLPKPFKTIQMGYVWRAERSQKGRYRQFMQCDIDYLGSASIAAEIELIHVTASTLSKLEFNDFSVRVNDRRILEALARHCGIDEANVGSLLITLDKLDKIGLDGVISELQNKSLGNNSIDKLRTFLNAYERGDITLDTVQSHINGLDESVVNELQTIISTSGSMATGQYDVVFDLSLVRGMGYYTGPIFEVTSKAFGSSLAGGGRYDNMIGKFLKTSVPACGFSIGFERILNLLQESGTVYQAQSNSAAIIFDPAMVQSFTGLYALADSLRRQGQTVTLEIKQKNLKQQLQSLKSIGVGQFCQLNDNDIEQLNNIQSGIDSGASESDITLPTLNFKPLA